jgi:hypothetical protein
MAMPEYAKGTKQAIAATKKATTPEKTALSNAPKYAISNAAAEAQSNINKYDVAKADQKAKNDREKKAVVNQVEKGSQSPVVVASKKLSNILEDSFSKAINQQTPVKKEPSTTLFENVSLKDTVSKAAPNLSTAVSLFDAFTKAEQSKQQPAMSQQASTQGISAGFPVVPPTPFSVVTASTQGTAPAWQYTADDQPKSDMFTGTTASKTSTQQDSTGATKTEKVDSGYATSQYNRYIQALRDQNYDLLEQLEADSKAKGWSIPSQDVIRQINAERQAEIQAALASTPTATGTTASTDNAGVMLQKLKQQNYLAALKNQDITRLEQLEADAKANGWALPSQEEIDAAFRSGLPEPLMKQEQTADKADQIAEQLKKDDIKVDAGASQADVAQQFIGEVKPADLTKAEDLAKEIKKEEPAPAPLKEIGMKTDQESTAPTAEEMQKAFENAALSRATEMTDKKIAEQNAEIDKQIALAINNRDFSKAEQLNAFKEAQRGIQDTAFRQQLASRQQMANRGLTTSGLAQDAQVRLQMSMDQNLRNLYSKQQDTMAKLASDFQTRLDAFNEKKQKLAEGRETDIQKATNDLIKEATALDKMDIELRKLQLEENKVLLTNARSALDRLKSQGYNTAPFEAFSIVGDVEGLARALQNTTDPTLSLLGQDMLSKINLTNAEILKTKRSSELLFAQTKGVYSDIDKQRSDTTGFIHQNGVMLKDRNGNPIPTVGVRKFAEEMNLAYTKEENKKKSDASALALKKLINDGNQTLAREKLKASNDKFYAKLDQDFEIAAGKIASQQDKEALNNQIDFAKSVFNSANTEINALIAQGKSSTSAQMQSAVRKRDAAATALGDLAGLDYRPLLEIK